MAQYLEKVCSMHAGNIGILWCTKQDDTAVPSAIELESADTKRLEVSVTVAQNLTYSLLWPVN